MAPASVRSAHAGASRPPGSAKAERSTVSGNVRSPRAGRIHGQTGRRDENGATQVGGEVIDLVEPRAAVLAAIEVPANACRIAAGGCRRRSRRGEGPPLAVRSQSVPAVHLGDLLAEPVQGTVGELARALFGQPEHGCRLRQVRRLDHSQPQHAAPALGEAVEGLDGASPVAIAPWGRESRRRRLSDSGASPADRVDVARRSWGARTEWEPTRSVGASTRANASRDRVGRPCAASRATTEGEPPAGGGVSVVQAGEGGGVTTLSPFEVCSFVRLAVAVPPCSPIRPVGPRLLPGAELG